jgi:hypothetical protein
MASNGIRSVHVSSVKKQCYGSGFASFWDSEPHPHPIQNSGAVEAHNGTLEVLGQVIADSPDRIKLKC